MSIAKRYMSFAFDLYPLVSKVRNLDIIEMQENVPYLSLKSAQISPRLPGEL
jgi:hypothetical protein